MVTPREGRTVTVVSREVSPARVLPPLFVKTQTGAVVTKVTQQIHGVRRVVTLNPSLPPTPTSVRSPYEVPRRAPARSGLPFATPPRARAVDLHARAASSQRFETPPKVARPPPLTSAQLEQSPSASLPTLLAAKAMGQDRRNHFQDAPGLASKEPEAAHPTEQARNRTSAAEDQQDEQAAPAKEQTSVQEATLEATTRTQAQTLQEQREQYQTMLEEHKEVQQATLEAAMREHAQTLQEQRERYQGMLEEHKEVQNATLEAAMRAHAQALQEQREHFESMLEVERRRADQAEAKLAIAEKAKEEEQTEIQEATLEAAARAHSQALQEQRGQYESMLEVERRRAEQAEAKLAIAEKAKEEEQKEIQEATLEAAMQAHEQTLQEQREQYESMLEVERGRAELERGRRQQAEAKFAMALELKDEALATMKTMSEAHEQKLEEMQALRKYRLLAEAEIRKLQAELKKFSVVSISNSEKATEAEPAATSSSSTPPDAQPHPAETQPSFRASSSTRQIAQRPPASAQTHTAGEMPRSDYRDITCWQDAGVYGKNAAQLRAGRRAAEDGTSEQEQAERVQEVRTLYRAKYGPHSTPNATQLLEFARTVGKRIMFSWVREEAPKP